MEKPKINNALKVLNIETHIKAPFKIIPLINFIKEIDFEKSLQDEFYSFNKTEIIFNKTGLEIKEKLNYLITKEEIKKENLKNKIEEFKLNFKSEPTKQINQYQLKNVININIELLPKKYDLYDIGFDAISQRDPILYNESNNEEINEIKRFKIRYNELVDHYVETLVEIFYLNSFSNNLEDNEIYPLTPNQIIIFGF